MVTQVAYKILLVIRDAVPEATPELKQFSGKLLHYAAELVSDTCDVRF